MPLDTPASITSSSWLRRTLRGVVAAAGILALSACASSGPFGVAQRAEASENFDVAVAEYTRALHQHPNDQKILIALDRVRLLASQRHYLRGQQLAGAGRYDDALLELQVAAELSPGNSDIARDLKSVRASLRAKLAVEERGKTTLENVLDHTREMVAADPGLPDVKLPASISMGQTSTSRLVYLMLGQLANLNIAFDSSFVDAPASVSFKSNMSIRDALDAVSRATNTFYKVTAPGTITVVPNTPVKQREYLEEWVHTFYVQNADLNETIDMLKAVADVRAISKITGTNAISIRDTPERLQAVGKLLQAIDKARPEVIIDVEILEVDRTKLNEYGLQIASPGSPGINGAAAIDTATPSLQTLSTLTTSNVLLTGVPTLYYRLLKTDTNTRTLANPHMRASDGIAASEKFGQQVPVPNAVFAPIAQGGVNEQPITSYTYQNVGVTIEITPRTHADDDVTLALKVVLSEQGAAGFNGLPTFGNREINTTIRLKDGETSILAGLVREDDNTELDGLPGLSSVPFIGHLFSQNHHDKEQTDVILALTPHIVRVLDITEADLMPFRILRDNTLAGSGDAPLLVPTPPRDGREGGPPTPPVTGAPGTVTTPATGIGRGGRR